MDSKSARPVLGVSLQDKAALRNFVLRLVALCTFTGIVLDGAYQWAFFTDWPSTLRSLSLTMLVTLAVAVPAGFWIGYLHLRANRLADKLEALKLIDLLTGLPNDHQLRKDFDAARHHACVLVIADVDHLANVNETFGHDIGDDVISQVARIAADELGDLGKLYRARSDEVIFLSTSAPAHDVASRVLSVVARVARTDFGRDKRSIFVTLSAGLVAGLDGASFARAYADVERALQNARTAGRNRLCQADQLLPFAGFVESDEISWESRLPIKSGSGSKRMVS